jgi:ATP-dependent helicase/nuclease subunit A
MPDLFGDGSRAEVAVAGLVGAIPVSGQIDRLIVGAGEVLLLDFKSARLPPASPADVPRGYVAQLALYRAVLQPIYPGRVVRAFLLWTAGPSLREVPGDLLDAALTRLQSAVKSGG